MTEPFLDFRNCLGIDNVTPVNKLTPTKKGFFVQKAENVDINDDGELLRRQGFVNSYGGNTHSIWANEDSDLVLFVEDGTLKKWNADMSSTILLHYVGDSRMEYVEVNKIVYFSNEQVVGFIKNGEVNPFSTPTEKFKIKMKGGQAIEYFKARLYAAKDNVIRYSDVLDLTRMDERSDFIQMEDRVTMIKGVDSPQGSGLYVGTRKKVYFMLGDDPVEGKFVNVKVLDCGAIEGSAIKLIDDWGRGVEEQAVVFGTPFGVYVGRNAAFISQLTPSYSIIPETGIITRATAILKDDRGYNQYLMVAEIS